MTLPLLFLLLIPGAAHAAESQGAVAAKPLYRDPVYDGAADPELVYNPLVKKWWMFYTNRRANVPGLKGVAYCHGTPIGIAESADQGATWKSIGTAEITLPASVKPVEGQTKCSYWAPDIVRDAAGQWHMFLTVVPGVFEDWGHPRTIVHLVSDDLRTWGPGEPLALTSPSCIDAGALQLPDGHWRLWYNDERDRKSIYLAKSTDLKSWTLHGKVIGDRACEAPKPFRWRDHYWLVVDAWEGLGVYRSTDAEHWERQPTNLLKAPGAGEDDQVKGGHCDVVVNESADRAWVFYFTHPGRRGADAEKDTTEQRRSSIQVAELTLDDEGWLGCERDAEVRVVLGE